MASSDSPAASSQQRPQMLKSTIQSEKLDPSLYTWSTLFNCLLGRAECTPKIREQYITLNDIQNEEVDCQRCNDHVKWNFAHSPTVRFMRDEIRKLGPDLGPEQVHCLRCPFDKRGGFSLDFGILVCANQDKSRKRVEDTLSHEMVHAYDYLRFDVSPTNLRHQACTEIRASMLSGECRIMEEWLKRKQFSVMGKDGMGQFQECVRRRATASMLGRKEVGGDVEMAEKVVREVWPSCFGDTRPFDEVYR